MKRWVLVVVILVTASCFSNIYAQDGRSIYAEVSESIVFLQHELYLDPAKTDNHGLWSRYEDFYDIDVLDTYLPIASGSGFFISDDGYLMTNRHVTEIDGVRYLRATGREILEESVKRLPGSFSVAEKNSLLKDIPNLLDESSYRFSAMQNSDYLGELRIVSVDAEGPDLALLKVDGIESAILSLLPVDEVDEIGVGMDVFSFGFPLGSLLDALFEDRVVTMNRGAISAMRPSDELDIQHSAAISPGNSGGPLVDQAGRVVGVNTAGLEEANGNSLFYSIGVGQVRSFLRDQGMEGVLIWNDRLAVMSGSGFSGLHRNSKNELLSSPNLFLEVSRDTKVTLNGEILGYGARALRLESERNELSLESEEGVMTVVIRIDSDIQGPSLLQYARNSELETILFRSEPTGVSVIADGRKLGTTPFEMELPAGRYTVKAEKEGYRFADTVLDVPGPENEVGLIGERTYPVFISGESVAEISSLVFRSENEIHRFESDDDIFLPAGDYTLILPGSEPFTNIEIPVPVGESNTEINLDEHRALALLTIRGYDPASRVWVNDEEFLGNATGGILLPVGSHTISIWQDGFYPVQRKAVDVHTGGQSYVIWPARSGNKPPSKVWLWGGIGTGAVGVASAVMGLYFGQDSVALENTSSYDEYLSHKNTASVFAYSGLGLVVTGALTTIYYFIKDKKVQKVRDDFDHLQ